MLKQSQDKVDDARIQQEQSEQYVRAQQGKMKRRNREVKTGIFGGSHDSFLCVINAFLVEMRSKGKMEDVRRLGAHDDRSSEARGLANEYLEKNDIASCYRDAYVHEMTRNMVKEIENEDIKSFLAEMQSEGKTEETCSLDTPEARYNVARMLAIKYLEKNEITASREWVDTMATSMLADNDHEVQQARGPEQQRCSSPFSFEELKKIARQHLQEKEELKKAAHQPLQGKKAEAGGHLCRVLKSPPPSLSPKSAVAARRKSVLQFLQVNDPKNRWSPVALKRKNGNSNKSSPIPFSGRVSCSPVVVSDRRLEEQDVNDGIFDFSL